MKHINPWMILGVKPGDDLNILKSAHKSTMRRVHPDHGGNTEAASDTNLAFEFFKKHLVNGCVPSPDQLRLRQASNPQQQPQYVFVRRAVIFSTADSSTQTSTTNDYYYQHCFGQNPYT